MPITARQFQAVRDDAWMPEHAAAMECRTREDLITRVHELWDDTRQLFASVVPESLSRDAVRETASVLRMAGQALSATVQRAARSVAKGYVVEGLDVLLACQAEARALIALPVARVMAARDPDRRTPEQIAHLLVRRARDSRTAGP